MSMKVIGKEAVDYVSRKTNQPVKGITLYCTEPREGVNGLAVERIFISARSSMYGDCMALPLDTDIMVAYNRYGSVDFIQRVSVDKKG